MESILNFNKQHHIIHSYLGLAHTLLAVVALVVGTYVLLRFKGDKKHRQLGYVYVTTMLLMNTSALFIYNFGKFNLFHFFALFSLGSIALGIIPAIQRKKEDWLNTHYNFMSWSVIGLWCAFWAEMGVRLIDMRHFWWVVVIATVATSIIGAVFIRKIGKEFNLVK